MPGDPTTSTRADYVAMVERVDRGVGEVLRAAGASWRRDTTIVIFTNDNGGEWLANNAPLFNRKSTVWEGGIRVPAIDSLAREEFRRARCPIRSASRWTSPHPFLRRRAPRCPPKLVPRASNLLPILEGRAPEVSARSFGARATGNRRRRQCAAATGRSLIDGTHTFVFNVRTDISERQDLASRRQDIAQKLQPLLADWERDVDAEAKSSTEQSAASMKR